MAMLDGHARALVVRDRTAWADGLDPAPQAQVFSDQQRRVFQNLAELPLSAWWYRLRSPVTDAGVLAFAASRLGARVVIVQIDFEYALAGVDPLPTVKHQWLTAARRTGGWKLSGDSDAVTAGGRSWRGPWDFGQLRVRRGPHTLVVAHPAHAGELSTYAALVEQAIRVVSRVWSTHWNDDVGVLIPDDAAEFAQLSADSGEIRDLAALAVADRVAPDGTVIGARIVLNPDTLSELDGDGRVLVVRHELTHVASRAATGDQMPSWVVEGFADYVGNLGAARPVRAIASELGAEIRRRGVPPALPGSADFDAAGARLPQAYEEAWLACRLIARLVGEQGLVRFYRAVSTASRSDPSTAVAVGLHRVLRSSVADFTRAWRSDLAIEFR